MNKKKYFIVIALVISYVVIVSNIDVESVEELDIITGVGFDIKDTSTQTVEYSFPFSIDVFYANGKKSSALNTGEGITIGDTIQNRQKSMNKYFIQGLEKVFVISEDYAEKGIRDLLEERSRSNETSDMAYGMVCKGKSEDILNYKKKGYSNITEYLSGLIKLSNQYNFFSQNYKIIDMLVRVDSEGRRATLPYIEINNEGIEVSGLVVFKKDKMALKVGMKEARILNLLKEEKGKGMFAVQKSSKEYTDVYLGSERKVECYKEGNNYKFIINLMMAGTVESNDLYKDLLKDIEQKKKLEEELKEIIEQECYSFLEKMKNEYKIDCLSLGRVAAAKYGRRKAIDWDTVVCNSDIKVKVKVAISNQGRGDY